MILTVRNGHTATIVRRTTFNANAPWRKHGTERDVGNRKLAALDTLAHVKATYTGPGYIIRKARVTK